MIIDRDRAEMFAGWFRCLADPTRIQILSLLASERREMTVGEIVAAMDVSQSTVSEHLRRLAETCFVLRRAPGHEQPVPDQRELHRVFPVGRRARYGHA